MTKIKITKKLGIYVMIIGIVVFLLGFPLYAFFEIDTDVIGLLVFIIGLIFYIIARVRKNK